MVLCVCECVSVFECVCGLIVRAINCVDGCGCVCVFVFVVGSVGVWVFGEIV